MNVWTLITMFGGAIAAIIAGSALAKYLGWFDALTAMSNIFQSIWHVIRIPLEFVLNHLPKPVKIFLVLLIISFSGAWIYSMTIGLTYVCVPNEAIRGGGEVYKVNPFIGFAWVYSPDDPGTTAPNTTSMTQEGLGGDLDGNLLSVKTYPIQGKNIETTVGFGEINDLITMGNAEFASIMLLPPKKRFETIVPAWAGGDGVLQYPVSICMNRVTGEDGGYCIIQKETRSNSECSLNFGTGTSFLYTVGRIRYFWEPDDPANELVGKVRATFQPSNSIFNNIGIWGIGQKLGADNLGDCWEYGVDSNTVIDGVTDHPPERMTVHYTSWQGDLDVENVPVYNTGQLPMLFTDPDPVTGDRALVFEEFGEGRRRMFEQFKKEATLIESSANDLVKYSCDSSSDNKYKTKITVGGINPFDVTFLAFVFVMGIIVSIYGWFRRL